MTHAAIHDLRVYIETDAAICVARPGMDKRSQAFSRESTWIPKSFLTHDENELNGLDDEGTLVIPKWLADQDDFTEYDEIE